MADTNETIADIIAEKRFDATTRDQFDSAYIVDFCDRLEAARKRELLTKTSKNVNSGAASDSRGNSGDCAKLREALKLCLRGMCGYCRMDAEARGMTTECVNGCQAMLDAKAALAAPPRNCDRDLSDRQSIWAELRQWVHAMSCGCATEPSASDAFEWLLAPATEREGGNDGSK